MHRIPPRCRCSRRCCSRFRPSRAAATSPRPAAAATGAPATGTASTSAARPAVSAAGARAAARTAPARTAASRLHRRIRAAPDLGEGGTPTRRGGNRHTQQGKRDTRENAHDGPPHFPLSVWASAEWGSTPSPAPSERGSRRALGAPALTTERNPLRLSSSLIPGSSRTTSVKLNRPRAVPRRRAHTRQIDPEHLESGNDDVAERSAKCHCTRHRARSQTPPWLRCPRLAPARAARPEGSIEHRGRASVKPARDPERARAARYATDAPVIDLVFEQGSTTARAAGCFVRPCISEKKTPVSVWFQAAPFNDMEQR